MITVYSKPACVQCTATTRELDRKGIAYKYVDLAEEESAISVIRDLGYMQVPVVVTDNEHWSGFRPDKIAQLTEKVLEDA